MLEAGIRTHFYKKAKAAGCLACKFKSGITGVPDEILIVPAKSAKFHMVELKRPEGGVTSERQKFVQEVLRKNGVSVLQLHTKLLIDEFFNTIRNPKCRK